MAQPKTQPNDKSVTDFLDGVEDDSKREDSFVILELMKEVTGSEPIMWGDSIIGFGNYRYLFNWVSFQAASSCSASSRAESA